MKEYIVEFGDALYNEETGEAVFKPKIECELIRCKDCKYAYITNDGECKYCDIWFPVEAKYLDGDYYCASAERKES